MERVYTTPLLDKLGIRPGMRVDNKVASFSATHTSLRLVIPLARRGVPSPHA